MKRFVALFVLASALTPGPVFAAPPMEFLAPAPGSAVTVAKPVLIGRIAPGHEEAELTLNGKPIAGLRRQGDAFSAELAPAQGANLVEARVKGILLGKLSFRFGAAAGVPAYSYHQPLMDNDCAECHQDQKRPVTKAKTCFGCHEAWKHAFQHGPVAAGECLFCHDPHGSVQPRLARTEIKRQCTGCHSQSSSKGHLENAKNQNCTNCHDPHGGSRKFFLKK